MVFHLEFSLLKSAINILSPALQVLQEQDRTEKVNAARQAVSIIITNENRHTNGKTSSGAWRK